MKRTLSNFLETIGSELHDTSYVDASGTIRPITKDEQLAREIWRRALGYETEVINADQTVSHRVFAPDPKMQQFLIERREGKFVAPLDDKTTSLLEKISELAKAHLNASAEKIVNDRDTDESES